MIQSCSIISTINSVYGLADEGMTFQGTVGIYRAGKLEKEQPTYICWLFLTSYQRVGCLNNLL